MVDCCLKGKAKLIQLSIATNHTPSRIIDHKLKSVYKCNFFAEESKSTPKILLFNKLNLVSPQNL